MGRSTSEDHEDSERTPLLLDAERPSEPRQTTSKKCLRVGVVIFATAVAALVVFIICIFGLKGPKQSPKTSICNTPACIHASSEILYNLSPKYKDIDPCTNFEELVCGGWKERHDLRPDQGDAFTGTIMSENSQLLLKHILEEPYPEDSKHSSFSPAVLIASLSSVDQQNFEKLKHAYDACMDEEAVKNDGIKPLKEIINNVADLFPVPDSAFGERTSLMLEDSAELADTIGYLAKIGVTALLSLGVGADDKDPDTVVVQISPPYKIGLPAKNYYENIDVVKNYTEAFTKVLEQIHLAHEQENSTPHVSWASERRRNIDAQRYIQDYAQEVVEFEKKLAAASPDAEDSGDVTKYYNPMSLKDASSLTPQIQLSKIIDSLAPTDVETNRLIVSSPKYMGTLATLLSDTPKEVLQIYFIWKATQAFTSVLEADELKPYTQFENDLRGRDPNSTPERWRTCVSHVDDGLGWILSRFFVEKAFSADGKDFGDQIVSDIKEEFIGKLQATTWMDKSVIKLAIEKTRAIVQKIGYPTKSPNIMDPPTLLDYYQSVNITPSSFFANALAMSRFAVSQEWSSLGKPVDHDEWGMTVPTVNAYYNPPGNEIVFPAGIMQFPVFGVDLPQYISYGAFGSVAGHELSHAFDSNGRHYDQSGNYTDWWTNNTIAGFKDRAECFVGQYHNFTVPGPDDKPLPVNGKLTLGENIADAGGVASSFSAWKKRQEETPNQHLPGLDFFSKEQLFFVSYANWWCGKSTKEAAISRIYSDPHAPKWARILGTMANSRDFKTSFQCPSTEPVCELW